jgi:hypothetical protein
VDAHDAARLASFVVAAALTCLVVSFLADAWGDDAAFAHRDFHPFWQAGARALSGRSPYERTTQPFVHPPIAIPIVATFALVSERAAFVVVDLLMIAALVCTLVAIARACGASARERATAIAVGATAPSFYFALFLGQLSGLYVACFAGCFAALALGADVVAGILAGLLTIKPPLALAPVLGIALARSRRAGLAFVITMLALMVGSLPWGIDAWPTWTSDARWWAATLEAAPGTWWRQWTLYAFVRSSMAEVGLSEAAARLVSAVVALPLAGLAVRAAAPAMRRDAAFRMRAGAVLALATVSLNAYLFYYDALLLVAPALVAFFLRETYAERARVAITALVVVSWALQLVTPLFGQGGVPLPGLVATLWLVVEALDLVRALGSAPPARR